MPQRLTPADAAVIVDGKLKAQEAAAKAQRASAAERVAEARAWQAQAEKMITAACEGHCELVIEKHPIKTPELHRLGFRIFKEVEADGLSTREALESELSEIDEKLGAALSRFYLAISRWVGAVIDRPVERDLEREIVGLAGIYKYKSIKKIFASYHVDRQFNETECREIIDYAIESDEIHDWFSFKVHIKEIDIELTEIRELRSEQRKVKAKLAKFHGLPRMIDKPLNDEEVISADPPFKISWSLIRSSRRWVGAPLVSASSLSWIASSGQLMLEAVESMVSGAANSMRKNVEIEVHYSKRQKHILVDDRLEFVHFLPPDELKEVLRVVGWNPIVGSKKNCDYTLKLNW